MSEVIALVVRHPRSWNTHDLLEGHPPTILDVESPKFLDYVRVALRHPAWNYDPTRSESLLVGEWTPTINAVDGLYEFVDWLQRQRVPYKLQVTRDGGIGTVRLVEPDPAIGPVDSSWPPRDAMLRGDRRVVRDTIWGEVFVTSSLAQLMPNSELAQHLAPLRFEQENVDHLPLACPWNTCATCGSPLSARISEEFDEPIWSHVLDCEDAQPLGWT